MGVRFARIRLHDPRGRRLLPAPLSPVTLGGKLFIVFLAFLAVLGGVIWRAFRERSLARAIPSDDLRAQEAADGRVMATIFGAILGGMFLTFLVAWLVFF